jgi:hypothetical protein
MFGVFGVCLLSSLGSFYDRLGSTRYDSGAG